MQILIVDDEATSRVKMQTILNSFGQCQSAENGGDAIRLVKQSMSGGQPFQLITLDIEMPDMPGTQVLQIIRLMETKFQAGRDIRARIIMVTGRSDKEKVVACIQAGCDDYIIKPFNIQMVREKLVKFGLAGPAKPAAPPPDDAKPKSMSADDIFSDIDRALRKGDLDLPAQPDISINFRKLVKANAEVSQIAELLQKDMVIATKVIRVANSAIYRGRGGSINAAQAIGRIGIETTEQIVAALANQQLYISGQAKFKPILQKLWQHALATANAAGLLAEPYLGTLSVDPFVAGLLHDIGALALIQIIAEMEKRRRFKAEISAEALHETVQAFHTAFGGKLLSKWNFSYEYVQTVMNHKLLAHDAVNNENTIVHLANLLAKSAGYAGANASGAADLAETASAKHLHLANPQINVLIQQLKQRMEESSELNSVA